MSEYVIALDAMGGDQAPDAIVLGAVAALRRFGDMRVLLAGPQERLKALLEDADDVADRVEILPADDVIEMDESPMLAVRKKVNSSMVQAMLAVREGRAGAAVSAGNTGAVLACGMLRIGRIPGIERPALAPVIPGVKNPFLLIDAGANVDCQPRYLEQFGLMGSVYMRSVMGVQDPAVGLVNIGTEAEKGNRLTKETYQLMQAQTSYRFAGYAEARDIPTGDFDVVVADGFDGNIILKYTEGLVSAMMGMLKADLMASKVSKIGAALSRPAFRKFKRTIDYAEYGGADTSSVTTFRAATAPGATLRCGHPRTPGHSTAYGPATAPGPRAQPSPSSAPVRAAAPVHKTPDSMRALSRTAARSHRQLSVTCAPAPTTAPGPMAERVIRAPAPITALGPIQQSPSITAVGSTRAVGSIPAGCGRRTRPESRSPWARKYALRSPTSHQ